MAGSKNGIGANVGGIALLHTWGQALTYHPHVHMLVPAGGLSEDGMEWIPANRKFFVPVNVFSKVFRGILCKQASTRSGTLASWPQSMLVSWANRLLLFWSNAS